MAVDVEMIEKEDEEHLRYATEHNLVLVTQDRPFAGETFKHTEHSGLVCWIGSQSDFGGQIRALSTFADQRSSEQVAG
jgi:predicted nuclease of predicted toxin-antitoxin system